MRLLKKFVRKLYHLIWFLSIFIFFLPIVKAESDTMYEITFLNRGYMTFPFSTGYAHHEGTTYNNNLRIYGNSPDVMNPPKYLYLVTCSNGNIDYGTNSVSMGNLVHYPQTMGMSCRYTHNGTTYNGYYYLDRWSLTWANYSGSGTYEYGIQWNCEPYNNTGYWVPIRFESIFMSNELIIDFDSYALLYSMVNSNGTINNNINSVKQDTNALKQGQAEIKAKQDETNQKLGDIDDTLNDDNVNGANSQVDDLLDNSNFDDSTGIQSIINAPLNFINSLSNTCSPINVTIPYIDEPLQIPCIKQELNNHVPLIVPILSTAINGFIVYRILLDLVRIIKNSRNPDDDRIEVLDL